MRSSGRAGNGSPNAKSRKLAQLAAVDFEDFYRARKPARCKRGDLLVISADGKRASHFLCKPIELV